MTIDIIIPNYNGVSLLKKNLPKILSLLHKNIKIIVADDASTDESVNFVSGLIPENKNLSLVTNKVNKGFASNVNSAALKSKADIIILLNTDVVPEKEFIEHTIEDFEMDDRLFGIGFLDKSIEKGKTVLRGRGIGKFDRGFLLHSRGEVDRDNTLWVSGGSCAIKRELFVKLEGFDELYDPFYWEDIDLSYRALKFGFSTLFDKRISVEHRHEEGSINSNYSESQVKKIAFRNQFIFVWKNITDFDLIFSHFIYLPYHLLLALLRFDISLYAGFALACLDLPDIILKRSRVKSSFRLKDRDILQNYTQ